MRVYSIEKNHYNYPKTSIKPSTIRPLNVKSDNFVKTLSNEPSFGGLRFNYNGLIIKYLKIQTLRTSIKASKRPYLTLNKCLNKITNPVKIKVSPSEQINAFDINPKNSDKYVIFLHGFSQNVTGNQALYEAISKTDYGLLAIDYRGYGKNPKTIHISENDMAEDILAAKKYLNDKGINNIGLLGHSFGAYLATKVSRIKSFDFQVLVSPMLSLQFWYENVLKHPKKYKHENFLIKYIPNFGDQYRKLFRIQRNIAQNSTLTYVIHSKTDRYIKYQDVNIFAQKMNQFKSYILVNNGGHRMDDNKISAIIDTLNNLKTT